MKLDAIYGVKTLKPESFAICAELSKSDIRRMRWESFKWAVIQIALLTGFFLSMALMFSAAHANQCGLKPMIPLGCTDAVCLCDGEGNCDWVYICDEGEAMKVTVEPVLERTVTLTASLEELSTLYDATRKGRRTRPQEEALLSFGDAMSAAVPELVSVAIEPDE